MLAWGGEWWTPTNAPPDLTNAIAISASGDVALALRSDGRADVWAGSDDQFGMTNAPPGLTNVWAIGTGDQHCLVVLGKGPPLGPVRLANPRVTNRSFQVSVPTVRGRKYFLEFADSPAATRWTMLPPVWGDDTMRTLQDPNPAGRQRFYRVRQGL